MPARPLGRADRRLGALPPYQTVCDYACEPRPWHFGGWTFFLLLPELVLLAGMLLAIARSSMTPALLAVAFAWACLVAVGTALSIDDELRTSLPLGPLFGVHLSDLDVWPAG